MIMLIVLSLFEFLVSFFIDRLCHDAGLFARFFSLDMIRSLIFAFEAFYRGSKYNELLFDFDLGLDLLLL